MQPWHSEEPLELPPGVPPFTAWKVPWLPAVFDIVPLVMSVQFVAVPLKVEPSFHTHVISLPLTVAVPVVAATPSPAKICALPPVVPTMVRLPGVRPSHLKSTPHVPSGWHAVVLEPEYDGEPAEQLETSVLPLAHVLGNVSAVHDVVDSPEEQVSEYCHWHWQLVVDLQHTHFEPV